MVSVVSAGASATHAGLSYQECGQPGSNIRRAETLFSAENSILNIRYTNSKDAHPLSKGAVMDSGGRRGSAPARPRLCGGERGQIAGHLQKQLRHPCLLVCGMLLAVNGRAVNGVRPAVVAVALPPPF